MAIIKGIQVTVQVNGLDLTEYIDEDEPQDSTMQQAEESVSSRYVEATSGAPFIIKMTVPKAFKMDSDCLRFRLEVDGVHIRSRLCSKSSRAKREADWAGYLKGAKSVENGVQFEHPLLFRDIKIGKHLEGCNEPLLMLLVVEEFFCAGLTPTANPANTFGKIVVKLHRKGSQKLNKHHEKRMTELNAAQEFTEKELKGLGMSHKTE